MKPILRILYILFAFVFTILLFILGTIEILFMFMFIIFSYIFTGKSNAYAYLEYAENLNNTLEEFLHKFNPDK